MFTPDQVSSLKAPLPKAHVKDRQQAGRKLSYVEAWRVIDEANRIFGFDGWTRETMDLRCVTERERKIGRDQNARDGWGVSYVARVRVIVFAGDTLVTREGVGSGHGIDVDLGLAHESAAKEAESDAMKRAMMTFGYQFGLALYDKDQEHVEDEAPKAPAPRQRTQPPPAPHVPKYPPPTADEQRLYNGLRDAIINCKVTVDLDRLWADPDFKSGYSKLPVPLQAEIVKEGQKRRLELGVKVHTEAA